MSNIIAETHGFAIITSIQKIIHKQEVIHCSIMQNNIFTKREPLTFIDTCSLLELPASELFLKSLRASDGKVIVLWAVIDELRKKIRDKDPEISSNAQKIFNLVFDYEAKGVLTIGLDDDKTSRNFADNIFLGAVFRYGLSNNVIIITQDRKLASDLLSTRNTKSVNGLHISVKRLEDDGTLSDFSPSYSQTERSNTSMTSNVLEIPASQLLQQFRNNREASGRVYKNQCMAFSGKVVRTHREGRALITELLSDDEAFRGRIICRFPESTSQENTTLERGQGVRISGCLNSVDTNFGDIEMSECVMEAITASSGYVSARSDIPVRVTSIPEEKTTLTQIPEVACKVKTSSGQEYVLTGIVAHGRKSIVYETESGGETGEYVAKIYQPEYCTVRQLEKLRHIVSLGLKCKGICFPVEILMNERGEFCGCLMPKADGGSIEELFCTPPEFARRFPDWKKTDMVLLTMNILDMIKYLHDNGVLMGNLVPENIMFMSTEEIYFVNADAWQYGEFPCPDGNVYATAPELQGHDFSAFLRTRGNENFAVAVLVFMLMMQGLPPYASFERDLPEEEIRAGKFPYTVGEFKAIKNYKAPAHEARKIWSHLVRQLKDTFLQTFHEKGNHNTEQTRYPVEQWIKDMSYYYACLPKMIKTDPDSEEIFPKETRKALDKRPEVANVRRMSASIRRVVRR